MIPDVPQWITHEILNAAGWIAVTVVYFGACFAAVWIAWATLNAIADAMQFLFGKKK